MKVKICGLTRFRDIDAVNSCKPDYVGFVFAESRRRVTRDRAIELKKRLCSEICSVGVFVNEKPEEILRLCRDGIIDLIQLHGNEDGAYISALKEKTHCPVIKAVRVRSGKQVVDAQSLPCDYLLLDTYQKNLAGGTGERFDYALIPELKKPFFLAGGIGAGNMDEAASHNPYCLDISSGAETNGVKDAEKIRNIVRKIRLLGSANRCMNREVKQ